MSMHEDLVWARKLNINCEQELMASQLRQTVRLTYWTALGVGLKAALLVALLKMMGAF